MDIPLQISFRNMDRSEAVEARVRERAQKLEGFFDRIVGCRVSVEAPHRHRHKGKQFHVRVVVEVPGKELVVSRDPGNRYAHEDVYVAVRDAFDAMQRQIEDHVRKIKGQVKTHEAPPQGRVVRLFPAEGYGFIELTDGQEVYFHRNAVVDDGFGRLEAGTEVRVEYALGESEHGAQATTVQPMGKQHIVE